MKFIFTCGGTAGHINPALAVAGKLREMLPDSEILFIGSGRELENRLVPMAGFKIVNIRTSGFQRSFKIVDIIENIGAAINLVVADVQMRKILRDFCPDAAIGTGGYVCYPVLKRIAAMGIPTLIHEANALPGLSTRMVSSFVDRVLVSFPGVEDRYKHPDKVTVTGMPVRGDFSALTKAEARAKLGLDSRPLVVSFWGSLGADRMNDVTADFIANNVKNRSFNHIHATGSDSGGTQGMLELLKKRGITDDVPPCTDLRPYIDDMPTVMCAADIVLCRAGASTIGELEMMGKPAVMIPSPYVANDHQTKNAEQLHNAGGVVLIRESDCTGDKLYETVDGLLADPEKLGQMSEALLGIARPDAAETIVSMMLDLINK